MMRSCGVPFSRAACTPKRSAMREADGHQHDVDERERGHHVDRAAVPTATRACAPITSVPGDEQVDAGRVLALEDHEHQQPRAEQAVADQRQRDVAA